MLSKGRRQSKTLVTLITFIRFFASVNSLMYVEVCNTCKGFSRSVALKRSVLIVSVRPQMSSKC